MFYGLENTPINHFNHKIIMFIPTTKSELKKLGWDNPEIILVTGDSYIDSPFCGVAVIGKVLINAGFRVAIIAQPDIKSGNDISRLGEPELFWGVTGGCIDSMVANYTATKKRRQKDDYTPGGKNERRPDRAVIAYTNLIKSNFKNSVPIVLGGLEASLRRIAHYDFWSNKVRRSILFDAKADYILYGMAEKSAAKFAECLKRGEDPTKLRGICYISKNIPENATPLPAFSEVQKDKRAFTEMFNIFYRNNNPITADKIYQQYDNRFLVQTPPETYLTTSELDTVFDTGFENEQHPFYEKQGKVKALETIRFSITSHRGCYGECNFCSIAVHQGQTVRWRSIKSIISEVKRITKHPKFKGIINDVGGPTANMYGSECEKKLNRGPCEDKRCIYPEVCRNLHHTHKPELDLLRELRKIPGIKKIFVASGIRYDLIDADHQYGDKYIREIATNHVSGQLKVAPEHSEKKVLDKMGKPGIKSLLKFREKFNRISQSLHKKQFLTYYMIAAHPGCNDNDMKKLKQFVSKQLKMRPEQIQVFTPTPSTYSTLMYWTEEDPFTQKTCFVEKNIDRKNRQKRTLLDSGY
jgi:uncharacterized radical SAM protein YgiQ